MNLVVPFGFYGAGNIGDEATLGGFAALLSQWDQRPRVSVASRNPLHCARVEPAFGYFQADGRDLRRWWAKYWATASVFAGGTPITDGLGDWPFNEVVPHIHAGQRRGCPTVCVGVGTEQLHHEKSRRIMAEEIAPLVRHWSVRSEHDRLRLIEYGVSPEAITVAADMAWLIEPASEEFGRRRLKRWGLDQARHIVAVNLVNENGMFEQQPQIAIELAAALDHLVEARNSRVLLLSNEVRRDSCFDAAAAAMVVSRMKRSGAALIAPSDYLAPREMMSIIGCCSVSISMRYHFCLFSALQSVPFVALTRSDKVIDFCWDLEWPASIKPSDVRALEFESLIGRAQQASTEGLRSRVVEMRRRAQRNLTTLNVLGLPQPARQVSLVSQ
jgi:polysaccharide pyruvyl transferase WcaK-like protein